MKTNEKDFRKNDELVSLNQNLYNEFEIQELEERLETDPLSFTSLLQGSIVPFGNECGHNTCLCDGFCMCDDFNCLCEDFCLADGWWE